MTTIIFLTSKQNGQCGEGKVLLYQGGDSLDRWPCSTYSHYIKELDHCGIDLQL